MKELQFPTQYSESVQKGSFEYFRKPSMTEPDNAMSIPEIIARFTRGQGLAVQQHPWNSGSASEEGYNPQDADINEFMEVQQQQQQPQQQQPQQQEPQQQQQSTAAAGQQQPAAAEAAPSAAEAAPFPAPAGA